METKRCKKCGRVIQVWESSWGSCTRMLTEGDPNCLHEWEIIDLEEERKEEEEKLEEAEELSSFMEALYLTED